MTQDNQLMYTIINEDLTIHESLNPKIWENNSLRPEVREHILNVIGEFKSYFSSPISIIDVLLCGSNASYNYKETSDLDVHIIADFDSVSHDTNILQALYDMEKSKFNHSFNPSVHGVELEVYVQDINSSVVSNGIYSVIENKWIKPPKPISDMPHYDLSQEIEAWRERISQDVASKNLNKINSSLTRIYNIRKNGLLVDGEYSKGNQLFKELRNLGLIDNLKDAQKDLIAQKLTLESLTINEALSGIN